MDTPKLEFFQLIDHAITIAEQMMISNQSEHLSNTIEALQNIKSQALAGQLEPSQGVSTLGLARGIADWIDSLDSPLLKAVLVIEQYYQRQYDS